jgi:hypothetical protein
MDPTYLSAVHDAASALGAPSGVLAAVTFLQALDQRDWVALLPPSEALAEEIIEGRRWINPGVVLDAGVMARLFERSPAEAGDFFQKLAPLSGRSFRDLRMRLLQAHLDRALSLR